MATFHHLILQMLLLFSLSTAATFTLTNNCGYTVWPGILSGAGTAALSTTGFSLNSGESQSLDVPTGWSGRLWGRTLCSTDPTTGKFACATADCGSSTLQCSGAGAAPPATLAEFTLNGHDGLDFYDVSLVDGYNLPMLVAPRSGSGNCSPTGCLADLNALCPSDLKVTQFLGLGSGSDSGSGSVACKSACEAYGTEEYCCSGAYGNPNTCRPTAYSQLFKNACPRAYSYAYDDATSTFTCSDANYDIIFCPSATSDKSWENNGNGNANPQATLPLMNRPMVFFGTSQSSPRVQLASPVVISAVIGLIWMLL